MNVERLLCVWNEKGSKDSQCLWVVRDRKKRTEGFDDSAILRTEKK
jgi:hypothetical protein